MSALALAAAAVVLHVAPATVVPGGAVTVSGTGWAPRSAVELRAGPRNSEADRFASVRTDARGAFSKSTRLSAQAIPGVYVFLACQRSCAIKATARLRVVRRTASTRATFVGFRTPSGNIGCCGNGLVAQHSRVAPFWVGIPQGWAYKNATYPSDHSTELWRDPKDAKSRLDVEVSACVMCAQPISCVLHERGCGPAPQVIVPDAAASRKRLDRYRMSYVLRGAGYPEYGLVWVMHDRTGVIGFALARVHLPAAKAALAAAILASFRI